MLLSDIFDIGYAYKGKVFDYKASKCEHLELIDVSPLIKRCDNLKYENLKVCKDHSFTVNAVVGNEGREVTHYFGTITEAESFRRIEVPTTWLETNYKIPEGFRLPR